MQRKKSSEKPEWSRAENTNICTELLAGTQYKVMCLSPSIQPASRAREFCRIDGLWKLTSSQRVIVHIGRLTLSQQERDRSLLEEQKYFCTAGFSRGDRVPEVAEFPFRKSSPCSLLLSAVHFFCSPLERKRKKEKEKAHIVREGLLQGFDGKHKWILFLTSCEAVSVPCSFGAYQGHQDLTQFAEFLMAGPRNAGQHGVVTSAYFITDQTLVGSCCKLVTVSSTVASGSEAGVRLPPSWLPRSASV